MELPEAYWPDIQANCAIIFEGISPNSVSPLPLLHIELTDYHWPSVDGSDVLLQRHRDYVAIGRRVLWGSTLYGLYVAAPTPKRICFDLTESRVLTVDPPSNTYRGEFGRSGASPRDHQRLHTELARGALYRQTAQ
jgi:hypothetical protein